MNCFPPPDTNTLFKSKSELNECTYATTKDTFRPQYWKRCYDCWPNNEDSKGACLNCITVCHDGHTVDVKPRYGNFFCDCGHENVSMSVSLKSQSQCKLMNCNRFPFPIKHPTPTYPPRPRFDTPDFQFPVQPQIQPQIQPHPNPNYPNPNPNPSHPFPPVLMAMGQVSAPPTRENSSTQSPPGAF